ncbi:MAG: NRDE family protein [Burkholderiaceae bacterium]
MCLIGFALDCHPDYRLIIAANRDEAYARPTRPAGWWPGHDDVHGGQDLLAGGSWMALNRDGRMAAVTNFRQPLDAPACPPAADPPSRGTLVGEFVSPRSMPDAERERFIARQRARVAAAASAYAGFNLLLFSLDPKRARGWWLSNRVAAGAAGATGSAGSAGSTGSAGFVAADRPIDAGVHSLSNALLDTAWPKAARLTDAIERTMDVSDARRIESMLFEALADRRLPPDDSLPDTGVGLLRERLLAPAFIATRLYGTRASTVVLIDRQHRVDYIERNFEPDGRFTHRHARFGLQWH